MTSEFYHNPYARHYSYHAESDVSPNEYHSQLPDFRPTPLTKVHFFSSSFDHVYIKDESERLGLPSFKILGASWGTFRAIAQAYELSLDSGLPKIREVAQRQNIHLVTATDGNHGRAIAYMARLLAIKATVFVPNTVNEYTRGMIRSEGADVVVKHCDYDATVMLAYEYTRESSHRLYIQDTSFEGYREIPAWIVQGYTTMLQEIEDQLHEVGLKATHIFIPVGVGSLAHAVVVYSKSHDRKTTVVAVESELASCLQTSLRAGTNTPIATRTTIMDGINCGTVSDISWPILKEGVDGAITISDQESHEAVLQLKDCGIDAGPCGASTIAALRKLSDIPEACLKLDLQPESVIVLLNTEGSREYEIPSLKE